MGELLNANIVCAGYADRPKVISDVSLTVNAGEIAGLIGANGAGILMCTHVLDTAEKICDRFYLLDQGALLLQGTLEELQEKTGSRSLLDCFYSAVRSSQR